MKRIVYLSPQAQQGPTFSFTREVPVKVASPTNYK